MDALTLLTGDVQSFLARNWASQPRIHKADPGDLAALLSLADVDTLLTSTALRTPALRVAKDGTVLSSSAFTRSATLAGEPLTGLVDARKVIALFDSGATLVLQGLHHYWEPLTQLVRDLEFALGHPCQANAYLTPPGSQGFALHSDTHDVFVFQTYGSKQWEVHDKDTQLDVLMEPGTCMYLPTGTPHAARTQSTASLHVTVGVNQYSWRQLLERVVGGVLADEAYADRLPTGYPSDAATLASQLADRVRAVAESLADLDIDELASSEAQRFLTSRNSSLRGGIVDSLLVSGLDDDTVLNRRVGAVCVIQAAGERVRLLLGDREMMLPVRLAEALEYIRDQPRLRPRDLSAWLDPQSRLVLARRLVREGLLQVSA